MNKRVTFFTTSIDSTLQNKDVSLTFLETIYVTRLEKLLRRTLRIIPEWRERRFFDVHSLDQKPLEYLWDCWVGFCPLKNFRKLAKDSG